jgi:hypothetical protein
MFDKESMSPDEWQFIRSYCSSVQRHYELLQLVRVLMNPDWLGVKCPITASRLANSLGELQQDFCAKIENLGHKKRTDKQDKGVKPEQIAEIFTLSFFKIVDPLTKQVFLTDKGVPKHDGWSSGHPTDWQYTVKSLQEIYEQKVEQNDAPGGLLLQALLKIFSALPSKSWIEDYGEDEDYQEEYEEYDDEDDYDDDPMSFFM